MELSLQELVQFSFSLVRRAEVAEEKNLILEKKILELQDNIKDLELANDTRRREPVER